MYADGYANRHVRGFMGGLNSKGRRCDGWKGHFNEAASAGLGPLNPGRCQRRKAP